MTDSTPQRVVLLLGGRSGAEQALHAQLPKGDLAGEFEDAAGHAVTLSLISWTPLAAPFPGVHELVVGQHRAPVDALLGRSGAAARARAVAGRSPVGRLALSLSPFDDSRQLWRAVRRSPDALAAADGADLVVAADLPAVLTAWRWLRSGRVEAAYLGVPPALRFLRARAGRS